MIIGIGVDIVSVHRIERVVERWGQRFIDRICTPHELNNMPLGMPRMCEFLAGRFAAKEAFLKALGTGVSKGVGFKDVWVVNGPGGRPLLFFSSDVERLVFNPPIKTAHVSLSHENRLAMAMVVLEG